jgi:hypothetical protein
MANGTLAASQIEMLSLSGTGVITITPPATNTNRTLTLPDATGTVLTTATAGVPVNGPAFNAYAGSNQTVTSGVNTKVQLNTEEFDTNSNFDPTTNYRFTPTVAGYYQVNGILRGSAATSLTLIMALLYKNGSLHLRGQENAYTLAGGSAIQVTLSTIVYLNGSTDYLELYGRVDGTGTCLFEASGVPFTSRMSGALIRSAV